MDFFTNQDKARKNTGYLVILFGVAVFLIICFANIVVAFSLWMAGSRPSGTVSLASFFNWNTFGLVTIGVNAVVGLAIVYKWIRLSGGGKNVAESLGGKRILPGTGNLQQQRMLNVVEEMALSSGMPVPPVYLLDREKGINAFAAGNTPADAVIGITQGSLDQFNREQLQGVVAHEFSHILNGDMRLNIRLIALLNGILFLGNCGRFLLRSSRFSSRSSNRSGGGQIVLLGIGLAIIGFLGTFFGGLIKAAINRQREFLADASAVQFTRNPNGIGDALKIIGGFSQGSRVLTSSANEASHLFISNALSNFTFFKSHPPLEERIHRIDPGWDGKMIKRIIDYSQANSTNEKVHVKEQRKNAALTAAVVLGSAISGAESFESNEKKLQTGAIPPDLLLKLHDPFTATSLLFALLLDNDPVIRESQLKLIREKGPQGASDMCLSLAQEISTIDSSLRLVLIEKSMPALKCMSKNQYLSLKETVKLLIQSDNKIELFEWCLFQLVRHYLGAEFGDQRPSRPRIKTVQDLADQYTLVLSTIIHNCHLQPETAERAFTRGSNSAGLYNAHLLPENECTMEGFMRGVNTMADSYPLLKARLLKGLVNVVEFDKEITPMEKELITCIAAIMDSPVPRLYLQDK